MTQSVDLFDWLEQPRQPGEAQPWRPEPLDREQWPPDYKAVYAWRVKQLQRLRQRPEIMPGVRDYYREHKAEFIMDWLDTYDPRVVGGAKWMPFVVFRRQSHYLDFLDELLRDQENGLVEKARDMGASWLSLAWSVATWLFDDDVAIGWGSRIEDLVDRIGDPDSLFEKLRLLLRRMPKEFLPKEFNWKVHSAHMRLINPENGSVIMGEGGKNIGRGGRKTVYFVDEAAHLENPESVEGALGDNTNVRVDISSVFGLGNPFHNKRENGVDWTPGHEPFEEYKTRVFVFDWSDHPLKTQEWYDRRRKKWEGDGLLHIFKQEVDRDYSGAVQNTIIPMEWIKAAIDAHLTWKWIDGDGTKRIGLDDDGEWLAALDVADLTDSGDSNALAIRRGVVLHSITEWGDRDTSVTTRKTVDELKAYKGLTVQYDCIGVGAGVKGEYNRLITDNVVSSDDIRFVPWNAGAGVLYPFEHLIEDDEESPRNKDHYANLKAQAWWALRVRFWRTYQNIVNGVMCDPSEMISISGKIPLIRKLEKELAQPTSSPNGQMKQVVDKKPKGTKSPNLADAVVMAFFPLDLDNGPLTGQYGA